MNIKNSLLNAPTMARVFGSNPRMLRVNPLVVGFLANYMSKFRVRRTGDYLILHSHLPPLNSRAYSRFVKEHLVGKTAGPSHAQIGVTNACPQRCEYCYNRNRQGQVMDKQTILDSIRDLRKMGVVWLGLTGGEPLLNKNLPEIVASASSDCAVKLFTTGCTLTPGLAAELKKAGLFSVSISLDTWQEEKHDQGRGYKGAFKQALEAIEIFRSVGGIQVGVSSVLSRQMISSGEAEYFLKFLEDKGVQEAWLSEVKPSLEAFWDPALVITERKRQLLVRMQDRHNAGDGMTVNYLGHFEGKECFGCNAGRKMVYIDAFGEVSPCVFTPMSFGNVQKEPLPQLFAAMSEHFPSEDGCFINKNFRLLQRFSAGQKMLNRSDSLRMLQEVRFGSLSEFNRIHSGAKRPAAGQQRAELLPKLGERL